MSSGLWEYAPVIIGVPLYVGVGVLVVRTVRDWGGIMARWNERRRDAASEKAGDWQRLREERDHYHELLRQCEAERADLLRRAIEAEAALQGYGEVRQAAAIASAEVRLDARDKSDAAKKDESGG